MAHAFHPDAVEDTIAPIPQRIRSRADGAAHRRLAMLAPMR